MLTTLPSCMSPSPVLYHCPFSLSEIGHDSAPCRLPSLSKITAQADVPHPRTLPFSNLFKSHPQSNNLRKSRSEQDTRKMPAKPPRIITQTSVDTTPAESAEVGFAGTSSPPPLSLSNRQVKRPPVLQCHKTPADVRVSFNDWTVSCARASRSAAVLFPLCSVLSVFSVWC